MPRPGLRPRFVFLAACAAIIVGAGFAQRRAASALDLGSSGHHNEAHYTRALPIRNLDFKASFSDDSYLIALFNRTPAGFTGVRLSKSPLFDSVYFEASTEGEFLRKETIPFDSRASRNELRFRIAMEDSGVKIYQDGTLLRGFTRATPLNETQSFGFRSGERPVLVEDVGIELRDRTSHDISWPRFPAEVRDFHRPRYYPGLHQDKADASATGHFRDLSFVGKGIRDPKREASKGPYRILFVGTSQTLGDETNRPGIRWTERFIKNLQHRLGQLVPIEDVVEARTQSTAGEMLAAVRDRLGRERFNLMVVDLSTYDYDRLDFIRSLESLASTAQDQAADILFILEPNSIEVDDHFLRSKHQLILSVAMGRGIPALDLHYRLAAGGKSDTGLVWRDYLNLTPFGQQLFSDALTEYFFTLIKRRGG